MKKKPHKIWFPSLLLSSNNINSNSWFDINEIKNDTIQHNMIKRQLPEKIEYTKTIKIPIYPNKKQKQILYTYFETITKIYNLTNEYLKIHSKEDKTILRLDIIRKALDTQLKEIHNNSKLNRHTIDYAVKHCIEMYKSCYSRFLKTNKEFNIRNLEMDRNRLNLVIEPTAFSKKINGFFITQLGYMKSEKKLKDFKHNCILQYQRDTKKYYIISPNDSINWLSNDRYSKCGIDLGVRTFATLYSPEKTIEIGNNMKPIMNLYFKRMNKLNSNFDSKIIKKKLYNKILSKIGNKMRNRIDDLHKKVSSFLTLNYKEIIIGKMSTKNMVSNIRSNIREITKRALMTLQFYRFNDILKNMAFKNGCNVKFINEYKTTKTCHNCHTENNEVGCSHIFKCNHCNIELGRDVNASINIYNMGFLKA
jgi:putative transposase